MDPNLPYYPFTVGGKEFRVKYPEPPETKTIRHVLNLIRDRSNIIGGILDINGCQMEDNDLFERKPFDPARPTYRFEPSPVQQGKKGFYSYNLFVYMYFE